MADNFRSLSPIRDQYIFVVRVVEPRPIRVAIVWFSLANGKCRGEQRRGLGLARQA